MIDIYDSHHDRRGETSARKLGLTLAARIPDTSCWLAGKLCQTRPDMRASSTIIDKKMDRLLLF